MFIERYVLDDMEHSDGDDELPECADCVRTKKESWPAQVVALIEERDSSGTFIGIFLCFRCYDKRLQKEA